MILFAKVLSNPLFIFYKENPFSYDQDMVCEKNFDRMSVSGSVAQGRCNQAMMVGICKMMKSDFLCPFLLSTVTYSVFPGILAQIRSVSQDQWGIDTHRFFVPSVTFFSFSCSEYLGRWFSSYCTFSVTEGPVARACWAAARIAFIPLFMMCNVDAKGSFIGVLIKNDTAYCALVIIFGWSHGYLANLNLKETTARLKKLRRSAEEVSYGSFFVFAVMDFGIAVGAIFSFFIKYTVIS